MALELRNIEKKYGSTTIFKNLTLCFDTPGFYLISGKSGSGKTTLLHLIAGYEPFDAGIRHCNMSIASVFQSYELIERLSVLENVRMACDLCGNPFDDNLYHRLGLHELSHHYPSELSGGQKQRVGFARALFQDPEVILLDEPTEALDIANKEIILEILKELSANKIIIVASHELEIMREYADVLINIEDKDVHLNELNKHDKRDISKKNNNKISVSQCHHYLFKAIKRNTIISVLLFNLLIVIQMGLSYYDQKLFTAKTSMDSLNANVVYVHLFNESSDYLSGLNLTAKPLLDFEPLEINQRRYDANIYPLELPYYELAFDEVIINDKMEKVLDGKRDLTLKINILGKYYEFPMKVTRVITEKDTNLAQVYYNHEAMIDRLGEDYNYYKETTKYYEVITDIKDIETLYRSYRMSSQLAVSHSILDWRFEINKQMPLYHLFYMSIQIVAMAMTLFLFIYFNVKDWRHNKTIFSLFCSLGVPLHQLMLDYLIIKIGLMIIPQCLMVPWYQQVGTYLVYFDIIYILSIILPAVAFKKKRIGKVLKDNKD